MDALLTDLGSSLADLAVVLVAGPAIYLWVIAATRAAGLRSFSKMSAFDFAMTVAVGSIIATVALGGESLAKGLLAVALLYLAQVAVSLLRRARALGGAVDNTPLLLLSDGEILDDHLAKARLTREDLMTKLRAAGVMDPAHVRAVVFETTGDVSVLRGEGPLAPEMLAGVRTG